MHPEVTGAMWCINWTLVSCALMIVYLTGVYIILGASLQIHTAPLCSEGDIRLRDQCTAVEGQVQICSQSLREWRNLCDDDWTVHDAAVVCRQLGYLPLG